MTLDLPTTSKKHNNRYMSKIFFILSMVFVIAGLGCSSEKKAALYIPKLSDGEGSEGSQTDVDVVPGVSSGSVLYFKLGMLWEQDSATEYAYAPDRICSFAPGAPSGVQVCNIEIAELQLYYSKLEFKMGTLDRAACPYVQFTPYYYQRSDQSISNSWVTPVSEIKCGDTPFASSCYGGAGPVMFSDFATSPGRYIATALGNEASYELKSSNSVRLYGPVNTNLMVTNDIVDTATGQVSTPTVGPPAIPAIANIFEQVPGSWQDYTVECKDIYGATTHSIVIKISDKNTADSAGGAVDHFTDWNR